ncbi:AAA family ATPase [Candidatus Sumerlaeota bacterium]|nr:AAA family ATPase [Candidatus Sumerlaeota bacterium]
MIYLQSVDLKSRSDLPEEFPFSLPLVRRFEELRFHSPVTFFVGENGSGKSTLLEAIATGIGSTAIGGESLERDKTLEAQRRLGRAMRFGWARRTHRGFFLRAEDFFQFARRMHELQIELAEEARQAETRYSGYGLALAKGSLLGQRDELTRRYGENLDANSHGESFLHLFRARFVPGGLYLLDEPEAPLSPQRQLALLSMIKEMVRDHEAQFLIATHSPILMAYPEAQILSFDTCPASEVAYDEIEHVSLTRGFLNNPEAFLRRL